VEYFKYPKTYHFYWSKPDPHGNDRVHPNVDHFIGKEVVVSCKLDGEGSNLYRDYYHARSIDSGAHPSRTWIKAFHAQIQHQIPDGYRLCGENLQAKHSICYENLPSYFFLFGIYDDNNVCFSWDNTIEWAKKLNVCVVPILYRGIWDEQLVKSCYTGRTIIDGIDCGEQEGYVVRLTDPFRYVDFTYSVSKYVRPGHVSGDTEHWSKSGYKPNKLIVK
jgi:RNA ligase